MRIGIDASSITKDRAGVGYYSLNLALHLPELDRKNQYFLVTNKSELLGGINFSKNVQILELPADKVSFPWIYKVTRLLKKQKVDYLISPANFTFGILFPNTIQFVHDLAPIKYSQFFSKKASWMYLVLLKLVLIRARYIATITNAVKEEIVEFHPKVNNKIFFAGMGINTSIVKEVESKTLESVKLKYNLNKPFFLSVGTLQPRKNYENTIKAFKMFVEKGHDIEYVIAGGKGWLYDQIFNLVRQQGLERRVKILGYVSQEDLPALYKLARGFLNMSFYEGFGMPSLEAYMYKVNVLTSDIPVFREVMQENAIFADPNSYDDIASKMAFLLQKNTSFNQKFAEQYSWESVSERIFNKILN